ncbi:MAG: hypothetical protein H7338_20485 [Candidatus Sericytochromatia bacterium]|nr:hypothetical protein [Candidatus Sericytochromatia bacterium]
MSVIGGIEPSMLLNGTSVGRVTVKPVLPGTLDRVRQALGKDGKDHIFYQGADCFPNAKSSPSDASGVCEPKTYVATGEQLNLNVFKKNILMVDGRRVTMLAVDNKVQSLGEGAKNTLRRLPHISSKTTVAAVGITAVGVALLRGARGPKQLIVTGVVAAGIAGVGAVGLSFYRARHPGALPGWLK